MSNASHPRVSFNKSNLTLTVHGKYDYEIDLEGERSTSDILDTIFQVAGKTWCDADLIKQLIEGYQTAAEEVFNNSAQGAFCPGGCVMKLDWKKGTYTSIRK